MNDIIVVGSCVQDLVSLTPRFPVPGEAVRGHKFFSGFGGKGANQAVCAARLGASVAFVGKVGNDVFGPSTVLNFSKHKINTDNVQIIDQASTGTASIIVDDSGQNCIVVVLGANEFVCVNDVEKAEGVIKNSKVMTCQLEIPIDTVIAALKMGQQYGVRTIFNPAPALPDLPVEIWKYADVVCPNENEAEMITGIKVNNPENCQKALDIILKNGASIAVITLGEQGIVFCTKENSCMVKIDVPVVKAIDTTGAGDCFVGSLAYILSKHPTMTLENQLRKSAQIASLSVQRIGTQISYPDRSELSDTFFD